MPGLPREELRRTLQSSARLRAVMTEAVRAVVYTKYDSRLDDTEASLLSETADLNEIVRLLRVRLGIARTYPGLKLTTDVRVTIAAAEVVADARKLHLTADERVKYLATVMQALAAGQREGRAEERLLSRFQATREGSTRALSDARRFQDRVIRLFTVQQNELSERIVDPRSRREAIEKLEALYAGFVDRSKELEARLPSQGSALP